MNWKTSLIKTSLALALTAAGTAAAHEDVGIGTSLECSMCAEWNQPQQPFQVYGNTYYVGTRGLSAVLVTGDQGHVLLDGALPQSAPLIERNIKALGFRMQDVKLILTSHAHFDHAGGIAALQRASGAAVGASAHAAQVLKDGVIGKDDPQYDPKDLLRVPKVARVTALGDGETIKAGGLAITAHMTPGHTPGGSTWSWVSCEKERCLNVVYADSLTAVSAEGFRFSGGAGTPDLSATFMATFDKVGALKCDVLLSTHPTASGTFDKLAARTGARNTFVDSESCRAYAAGARTRFAARLASEQGK